MSADLIDYFRRRSYLLNHREIVLAVFYEKAGLISYSEVISNYVRFAAFAQADFSPGLLVRHDVIDTVYRHLEALEGSLGIQIFDRHHKGWAIRKDALPLLTAGKEIERLLRRALGEIRDVAEPRSYQLRIAISEDLANHYIVPLLRDFIKLNDHIRPELMISSNFADLVQGDADVAIRPHLDPGDILVGRRVCNMKHAFYASKARARRMGVLSSLTELDDYGICGYGAALKDYTAAQWLGAHVNPDSIVARFDCTSAMTRAVVEGVGIGLLPCFVGDRTSSLKAVMSVEEGVPVDIWLVTAAANKKRPAVMSFFKFFAAAFRSDKNLFTGASYSK